MGGGWTVRVDWDLFRSGRFVAVRGRLVVSLVRFEGLFVVVHVLCSRSVNRVGPCQLWVDPNCL